jgi:hypothetical protein
MSQGEAAGTRAAGEAPRPRSRSNAWSDLALTLPVFLGYHLGVIFLDMRNAADLVTVELVRLADNHIMVYWGLTLAIGAVFVVVLSVLGRGQVFDPSRFVTIALEAALYAVLMRAAGAYVVGELPLVASQSVTPFTGVVMSLGAGFYEELAFRVGLFGLGVLAIRMFLGGIFKLAAVIVWALIAGAVFSAWHYFGAYGDPWDVRTFVFRLVCGLVFTLIYVFRGFAPAVWTHALYDIWVLAL